MILLTFMPDVSTSTKHETAAFVERRREPRIPTAGVCDVVVISPRRGSEKLTGMVVDVSRSGLQLELGQLIESGSIIQVHLRTLSIFGQVASCRQNCRQNGSSRFRVGVVTGNIIESA